MYTYQSHIQIITNWQKKLNWLSVLFPQTVHHFKQKKYFKVFQYSFYFLGMLSTLLHTDLQLVKQFPFGLIQSCKKLMTNMLVQQIDQTSSVDV